MKIGDRVSVSEQAVDARLNSISVAEIREQFAKEVNVSTINTNFGNCSYVCGVVNRIIEDKVCVAFVAYDIAIKGGWVFDATDVKVVS